MLTLFVYFLLLVALTSAVFFLLGPTALLIFMGLTVVGFTAYVVYLNRKPPTT